MKTLDRLIFGAIAVALMALALQPLYVSADRAQDVNIAAVGGKRISFGEGIPTR